MTPMVADAVSHSKRKVNVPWITMIRIGCWHHNRADAGDDNRYAVCTLTITHIISKGRLWTIASTILIGEKRFIPIVMGPSLSSQRGDKRADATQLRREQSSTRDSREGRWRRVWDGR